MAIKAPNDKGYVIAVNFGTFLFLHCIGMLFNRFLNKYSKECPEEAQKFDVEDSLLIGSIKKCIDEKTSNLFCDLIISSILYNDPRFIFTSPTTEELLYSVSGLGFERDFLNLTLTFIISHEYAHFCLPDHNLITVNEKIQDNNFVKNIRSWQNEFDADLKGLLISMAVSDLFLFKNFKVTNLDDVKFLSLFKSFSGAYYFMSCVEVLEKSHYYLEKCSYLINDKIDEFNSPYIQDLLTKSSHPSAFLRKKYLEKALKLEVNRVWGDSSQYFSKIFQTVSLFEKYVDILWKDNEIRIKQILFSLLLYKNLS